MFSFFRKRRDRDGTKSETEASPAVETGPPFFLPGVESPEAAARRMDEVRQRLASALKGEIEPQAYAALEYEHDGTHYRSNVGEPDPRAGETVACILRQPGKHCYLICTAKRGYAGGLPLVVAEREARRVVAFRAR
ncbi:hypothetical protein [Ferruginivarius sediminum]|uniref:Uncharacterized protein n=1 Tax=Ferruginivarius sediminum TaxID=2661937 RepID=A0A369TBP3_9PROT|nr:hypothetical protein [Ferruginivarius sediminum]RDD62761.1 hypothetical protein DRB17_06275 [Ferruginivarius sediminum]